MSDKLPYMPFWAKDWIASVQHWPCAERGAYISLLAFQWINGHVPLDVPQLARITGCTEAEFEKLWVIVGPKFEADEEGLFNKRAEEHRKEAQRLRGARVLGASVANEKRRVKREARKGAEVEPRTDAERTHPYPYPNPTEEEEKNPTSRRSARAQRVRRGTYDLTADEHWLSFKLAYPLRAGGQPWRAAMQSWRARVDEGYEPAQMIAGAERYALFVKAKGDERTAYVMHAKTFLGPEKYFMQDWELPEAANDERWTPPVDDAGEVA